MFWLEDLAPGSHAVVPYSLSGSSRCLDFSVVLVSTSVRVHMLQPDLKLGGALKAIKIRFEELADSKAHFP